MCCEQSQWCLSAVTFLLSKWKVNLRLGMYTRIHTNIGHGKLRTYANLFCSYLWPLQNIPLLWQKSRQMYFTSLSLLGVCLCTIHSTAYCRNQEVGAGVWVFAWSLSNDDLNSAFLDIDKNWYSMHTRFIYSWLINSD